MKNIFVLPFIVMFFLACSTENVTKDSEVLEAGELKLTTNKESFNDAASRRGAAVSKPFYINNVKREGNILKIDVSHTYACQGGYEVVWDGTVMESYPPQVRLYVKFLAECTDEPTIQVMVDKTLEVDLAKLFKDQSLLTNCIIHVANASTVQDVTNDENVSSK